MGLDSQFEISGYQHSISLSSSCIRFPSVSNIETLQSNIENRNSSTCPLPGLSGLFDYQGEIHDLVRHRKLLNFSPWPFRSHPAKLKVTIKSRCQHIIPCPGDPITVQMKLKLKSPKSSQLQRKSSQSVLEFHEKMRGFTDQGRQHRQRIWDLRLCFGTWHFRATQCWQPKFVPKIENVNPGTPSKTGSTRNINSSQCDIHVRLVSWIHSPGSTRETTLGEIPQKCAPWTPWTWSKRTENVWCHFCIQCLNPFTLPLNLPHLTNIELSWIILDYW